MKFEDWLRFSARSDVTKLEADKSHVYMTMGTASNREGEIVYMIPSFNVGTIYMLLTMIELFIRWFFHGRLGDIFNP